MAVIGASGSGKSYHVKKHLVKLKPTRLMIWDLLNEYQDAATMAGSLADVVKAAKGKAFKIRYRPAGDQSTWKEQFSLFCEIAYKAGRVCLVVEELAFVTTPSWAPQWWRMMTLTGRHEGMTVIGCSQRPASVDKDFWSNCTSIRCGRLNDKNDIRTMAGSLGVSSDDVKQLTGYQVFERDNTNGRIIFPHTVTK